MFPWQFILPFYKGLNDDFCTAEAKADVKSRAANNDYWLLLLFMMLFDDNSQFVVISVAEGKNSGIILMATCGYQTSAQFVQTDIVFGRESLQVSQRIRRSNLAR